MTDKQKLFVDEYLKCMNVTRAYKKVYKNVRSDSVARSAGNRLLSKPDIKAYKEQRVQEIHDENTADIQEVMEYLTAVMRGEQKDEVLTMNGDIELLRSNTKERNKAAELLAKSYGAFEKNVNLSIEVPVFTGESDLED